ncbi:MAG: GntR family transcriptional regulator [Clostridiaceae bacterium]|nr:GntR family transcriptional regulator [Clostridiaceae bacterium]
MLDQNALTPLYEQLKNAIKEDIKAQIYRPGDRMPSEAEMEEKYQVSRITVRRAVKELCDEEILVRRQGKGTFVLNNGVHSRIDRLAGFHDSLGEQGKKVEVKVLEKSIGKPKPSYARDLQMAPQDDIVYLKRIMYADDIPVMIDTCYIPMKRFPGIYDKLTGDFSIYRILREDYGASLDRYYKVLKVRKATKEEAGYLNCHSGDPVFDLFKITYDGAGVPQDIAVSILKGEDTAYVISSDEDDQMSHSGMRWNI